MNEEVVKACMSRLITEGLGLDLSDPNLRDTPDRVARMYCRELFSSLGSGPPKITTFPNTKGYDEIIMMDNLPYVSVCAHHFLPFQGLAWFCYIPQSRLLEDPEDHADAPVEGELSGASKIVRVINHFSAKPQLQEDLSHEIITYFMSEVKPHGAMLVMRGVHGCMACRGVKTGNGAGMTTSIVRGAFKANPSTKAEALALMQLSVHVAAR